MEEMKKWLCDDVCQHMEEPCGQNKDQCPPHWELRLGITRVSCFAQWYQVFVQ
jgi:hypothetical protein